MTTTAYSLCLMDMGMGNYPYGYRMVCLAPYPPAMGHAKARQFAMEFGVRAHMADTLQLRQVCADD